MSRAESVVRLSLGTRPRHQDRKQTAEHSLPLPGGILKSLLRLECGLGSQPFLSHLIYEGGWEARSFPEKSGSDPGHGEGCFRGTGRSDEHPCLLCSRKDKVMPSLSSAKPPSLQKEYDKQERSAGCEDENQREANAKATRWEES